MRATYEDWRLYYERADRVRAQVGDPFQRLIAREAFQRRLLRVAVLVLAMAALIALVWFGISLADNDSLESISEASVSEPGVGA